MHTALLQDSFFNFGATNEKWIAPEHRVRRARTAPSNASGLVPPAANLGNTQAPTLVSASNRSAALGALRCLEACAHEHRFVTCVWRLVTCLQAEGARSVQTHWHTEKGRERFVATRVLPCLTVCAVSRFPCVVPAGEGGRQHADALAH